MRKIQMTIKGLSAILLHKFPMVDTEDAKKTDSIQWQAEKAAYRAEDGGLFFPSENLRAALVDAAAYEKGKGRSSLVKCAAASLFVSPARLDFGCTKYAIDSRPVNIKATGGRIIRHRPRLDSWELACCIEYDEQLVTEKQVRAIVDHCGSKVGIGDFRPACKGPFGRFMVTTWKAGEDAKA